MWLSALLPPARRQMLRGEQPPPPGARASPAVPPCTIITPASLPPSGRDAAPRSPHQTAISAIQIWPPVPEQKGHEAAVAVAECLAPRSPSLTSCGHSSPLTLQT